MKANINCRFRGFLLLPSILSGLMMSGVAAAANVTHTDSFGIVWTLTASGANVGDAQYDIGVQANTTGFTSNGGVYNFNNTYINALTIQTQGGADPLATSSTTGPGTDGWTTVLGGQNQGGCNGQAAASGDVCAYSTPGGLNIFQPGVLMNANGNGILDWVFHVTFASGTNTQQALGNLIDNLWSTHLKADYYSFIKPNGDPGNYNFVGQISDDTKINNTCTTDCGDIPPNVPEPGMLALMGIGMFSMAFSYSRRRKFS